MSIVLTKFLEVRQVGCVNLWYWAKLFLSFYMYRSHSPVHSVLQKQEPPSVTRIRIKAWFDARVCQPQPEEGLEAETL